MIVLFSLKIQDIEKFRYKGDDVKNKALTGKISIMFTLLFTAIMFLTSWFNSEINNDLDRMTRGTVDEYLKQLSTVFENELEREQIAVETLAESITIFGYKPEETMAYIESIKDDYNFENIMIVYTDGRGVLSDMSPIDISDRDYFKAALLGQKSFSEPYVSTFTGKRVSAVASPIYYDGEVSGVLAAEYSADYLNEILYSSLGGGGSAIVLNSSADVMYSTYDLDEELSSLSAVKFSEDTVTIETIMSDIATGTPNNISFEVDGDSRVAAYLPLSYNDWTVMYMVNEDEVAQTAEAISFRMLIITLASMTSLFLMIRYILESRKKSLETIEHVAYYDELTGIRNLAKFKIDVAEILKKNKDQRYYVVKADVVNFKTINELYSYEVGNEVIKTLADAGRDLEEDTFIQARMSTDEFILFAREEFFTDLDATVAAYTEIFKSKLSVAEDHNFVFRFGRCLVNPGDIDVDDLVNRATMAHSHSKVQGTYALDYDDHLKKHLIVVGDITNKMQRALDNNEFKVYLQPKNCVNTGEIVSAEALVRWIEPSGHMYFPNDFIPLFESNGFIIQLDRYMLEKVSAFLKDRIDKGLKTVPVSVNFSRKNIQKESFVAEIKEIIDRYNIPSHLIEVELTETIMAEEESIFELLLAELEDAGFAVAIDDFGSGYSTLGMIRNLKVETLKLDKSFFLKDKEDERQKIVIDAIIQLAHNLGMETVAEGIETIDQLEFLKSVSCDIAQGYYFAKPMPMQDFADMLEG